MLLLPSPAEFIPATSTCRFLEGKSRVLVVGVANGGRDYQALREAGKEVVPLDIAPQDDIPETVIQSIEDRTPFPDGHFDGVVLNEVLEHLFHDLTALQEVHRILKSDGCLVVTVPYISKGQDLPEFHMRVQTRRTLTRLLREAGFSIEEHFYRGFLSSLPNMNRLFWYALRLTHRVFGKLVRGGEPRAVLLVNGFLTRLETRIGSCRFGEGIQRRFSAFGGIMKARKTDREWKSSDVQVASFQNVGERS
jgi:SAM-dependent methyltransferase